MFLTACTKYSNKARAFARCPRALVAECRASNTLQQASYGELTKEICTHPQFHKYAKNIAAKHKRKVVIATEQQEPAKDEADDGDDDDATGGSELLWAAEIQIGDHRVVAAFDTASFDVSVCV